MGLNLGQIGVTSYLECIEKIFFHTIWGKYGVNYFARVPIVFLKYGLIYPTFRCRVLLEINNIPFQSEEALWISEGMKELATQS